MSVIWTELSAFDEAKDSCIQETWLSERPLVMKKINILCIICLCVFVAASTALAKDKNGKQKKSAPEATATRTVQSGQPEPTVQVKWKFSDEERQVVQSYVRNSGEKHGGRAKGLPPGLSKKVARGGKLPPGWQDKCVVGEIMPPVVYEQCHPLPPEVVLKMPPPPEPTLTVTIGGKVVRLLKATREILDVFDVNVRF